MTTTESRATVRRRINQTSNTDTLFSDNLIDELVNQGRKMFAAILPERLLPELRVYDNTNQTPSSGYLAYRSDFLRPLKNKVVKIGSESETPVVANELPMGEEWRLKFLESNDLVKSGTGVKYYRETGNGVKIYPSSDTIVIYPYLKIPDDLDGSANTELPRDVEDMVLDYAFEKIMGTPHASDYELATLLARNRGYLQKEVVA